MEAIGRLAGGVAHDFNNLITGILGLSHDIWNTMASHDARREDLDEIILADELGVVLALSDGAGEDVSEADALGVDDGSVVGATVPGSEGDVVLLL